MTKIELMNYRWCRDFSYKEVQHTANVTNSNDVPDEEEYKAFSHQAFEDMLRFLDSQYEDTRTPHQRAKDELGFPMEDRGR